MEARIQSGALPAVGWSGLFGFGISAVWEASGIECLEHDGHVIPALVKCSAWMNPEREYRAVTVHEFNVARRLAHMHPQYALTVAVAIGFIVTAPKAGITRKLVDPLSRWTTIHRRIRN